MKLRILLLILVLVSPRILWGQINYRTYLRQGDLSALILPQHGEAPFSYELIGRGISLNPLIEHLQFDTEYVLVVRSANTTDTAYIYFPQIDLRNPSISLDGDNVNISGNGMITLSFLSSLDATISTVYFYYDTTMSIPENAHYVIAHDEEGISLVHIGTEAKLERIEDVLTISISPNPATSTVKISSIGVSGMVKCRIIDMNGRVVYNQNINADTQIINVSNIAKGTYFVRISRPNGGGIIAVKKLIIQ